MMLMMKESTHRVPNWWSLLTTLLFDSLFYYPFQEIFYIRFFVLPYQLNSEIYPYQSPKINAAFAAQEEELKTWDKTLAAEKTLNKTAEINLVHCTNIEITSKITVKQFNVITAFWTQNNKSQQVRYFFDRVWRHSELKLGNHPFAHSICNFVASLKH